jgi:uncharacterized protein involved in exopolysaccharide biosynthesis
MTSQNQSTNHDGSGQVSVLEFATFLLRHRRLIAGCALVSFLVVVLALTFQDRDYTSSASFVPQTSDRMSALAGLAAQFGVTAGGPDVTESPAFYADLLKTREVLTTILQAEYRVPTESGMTSAKLIDWMKVRERSDGRRLTKAIEELTKALRVELKSRTGMVAFKVQMPNAVLAQQVAQRFLDEVNRFNLEKRHTKAGAERRFTEARIAQLQRELREAEDRLQVFLQQNRAYRNSPELTFQHDRMSQEVDFRRTVYNTVSQTNERARMDEVRDTPVITIIERPSLPAKPDSRGLVQFGLVSLLLGGLAGVGIAFAGDMMRRRRASFDPEFAALSAVMAESRRDLGRILSRVRRPFHRGTASRS